MSNYRGNHGIVSPISLNRRSNHPPLSCAAMNSSRISLISAMKQKKVSASASSICSRFSAIAAERSAPEPAPGDEKAAEAAAEAGVRGGWSILLGLPGVEGRPAPAAAAGGAVDDARPPNGSGAVARTHHSGHRISFIPCTYRTPEFSLA